MNGFDLLYGLGVAIASPFWLIEPAARRKCLTAWSQRMGRIPPRQGTAPAIMIHAVSLGEINAIRQLIQRLRADRPDVHTIISTTTDTGFARAQELYGRDADVTLVRYPLDFTSAIHRLLDALRPDVVVLMELEVWPNFLSICHRRKIPVLVINGRLTTHSFSRYRMVRPLVAGMFRKLSRICAQDRTYAERFIALGADPASVSVTGTMKFDTASMDETVAGVQELAAAVGLVPKEGPVWVAGSTGPGEEEIILEAYRRLREKFPTLRLVLVPRKPERFNEVADLIASCGMMALRRSRHDPPAKEAVILGDTMGELKKFYALADVVFVGRTLLDLGPRQHGSDMIEPAALAKPVIVGPFTGNFAEPMACFLASKAMKVVPDGQALTQTIDQWLCDPAASAAMGLAARQVVARERGATDRHAQIILQHLSPAVSGMIR
ncbi:MAG TPA: 3-deoxy-D-manno-octulosonic acid transferase [Tepidisphaeraceae bacterium]|nr:3-deoxy-D-manno-octulosonic acid transferase [Tepidisphaeraceae bacterium]